MSPHVMYGSASLSALSYLSLSSSIVSCICLSIIYMECTTIHNAHLWVPLQERNNMTNRYKVFTFIISIIFYLYNTLNIIHKCTLNCKDFLVSSSSSSFYLYSPMSSLFYSPCSLFSLTVSLYLYSSRRYCKIGGKSKQVMTLRVIC